VLALKLTCSMYSVQLSYFILRMKMLKVSSIDDVLYVEVLQNKIFLKFDLLVSRVVLVWNVCMYTDCS
jgi:hypothetical protein